MGVLQQFGKMLRYEPIQKVSLSLAELHKLFLSLWRCHNVAGDHRSGQRVENSPNLQHENYSLQTFSMNFQNSCFARNLNNFNVCSLTNQLSYGSGFPVSSALGSTEVLQTNQLNPSSVLASLAEFSTRMQKLDPGLVQEKPSSVTCLWGLGLVPTPAAPQPSLRVNFTADLELVSRVRLQPTKAAFLTG